MSVNQSNFSRGMFHLQRTWPLVRGTWCLGWGVRECIVSSNYFNDENRQQAERTNAVAWYHLSQGVLYLAFGVADLFVTAHNFKIIDVGSALTPLLYITGFTFIFAQVQALYENIKQYRQAVADGDESAKKFAIFGMTSNLSYLFMALLTALGASFAITFVIGLFAFNTGMVELYYHWYQNFTQ